MTSSEISPELASRMQFLAQSEIRRMTHDCNRAGGINLAQGLCDMEVPEVVRRAAQEAIEHGPNTYVPHTGVSDLRAAVAHKLARFSGLEYDANSEIIITSGASGAFWAACLNLFDPGDEAILFEPYYGYHLAQLRACDITARFVELHPPGFGFDEAELKQHINARTRAIVINTPSNPSGKVFSLSELQVIASVAEAHDLWVVTDEIYEHFVYDGRSHVSPATVARLRPRCVTISGLSKTLSITGWRIGYCAAPAAVAERLALTSDLVYICAPAPLQAAVASGLRQLPESFYVELAEQHQAKRDRFCSALHSAGLRPIVPQGAYYVLADVSTLPGSSARNKVQHLLDVTGVAAVAGTAFYHMPDSPGDELARFCFAKTDAVLDEACRRLQRLRSR